MRLILLLRAAVVTAGGQILISTGAMVAVSTFGYEALLDIPHFVMQRKMLLEIKARAEARSVPLPADA